MDGFNAYRKHVNPALSTLEEMAGLSRNFVRALQSRLWDKKGDVYYDFVAGHGSFNLGHNPPEIVKHLSEAARNEMLQIYGDGDNPHTGLLAAELTKLAGEPFEVAFFGNSGSEAVEGAIEGQWQLRDGAIKVRPALRCPALRPYVQNSRTRTSRTAEPVRPQIGRPKNPDPKTVTIRQNLLKSHSRSCRNHRTLKDSATAAAKNYYVSVRNVSELYDVNLASGYDVNSARNR